MKHGDYRDAAFPLDVKWQNDGELSFVRLFGCLRDSTSKEWRVFGIYIYRDGDEELLGEAQTWSLDGCFRKDKSPSELDIEPYHGQSHPTPLPDTPELTPERLAALCEIADGHIATRDALNAQLNGEVENDNA